MSVLAEAPRSSIFFRRRYHDLPVQPFKFGRPLFYSAVAAHSIFPLPSPVYTAHANTAVTGPFRVSVLLLCAGGLTLSRPF